MQFSVQTIPPYKIAFIRQIGPYGVTNLHTMAQLKAWAKSNNLLNDSSIILGIPQDSPATTKPCDCRYDACLVLPPDSNFPGDEINIGHTHGGKYLIFKIDHTAEAIQNAWSAIFDEISLYDFHLDETRPVFERYAEEMLRHHACEICVPIG